MTVLVLLDPTRPTTLPVEALPHLTGPVYCTEEVPVKMMWNLPGARPAPAFAQDVELDAAVVSGDPAHPLVAALRAGGATVVATPQPTGSAVLETAALIDRLRLEGAWESRQTHSTLLRYLVEETYEFADAVARLEAATSAPGPDGAGSPAGSTAAAAELRSELGDLLLQVIFHARIAQDAPAGAFDLDDVARTLTAKVRRRTPHLGGEPVDEATQAANWEAAKAAERRARRLENPGEGRAGGPAPSDSCLHGISPAQPALSLAGQVLERLRTVGFPAELVPASVREVVIDPVAGDAAIELDYRARVLEFVTRVRAAEARFADPTVDSWTAAWQPDAATGTESPGPVVDPEDPSPKKKRPKKK